MNNFEYIGGRIWSLLESDEQGYDKTVLSLEIECGRATVVCQGRQLTDQENSMLVDLLKQEEVILGNWL